MVSATKLPCHLCYYDTTDTVDLFADAGKDYVAKIRKYLYLVVQAPAGEERMYICWMCCQQLETFHKFYVKMHEIQKSMHKDLYAGMVLPDPIPHTDILCEEDIAANNNSRDEPEQSADDIEMELAMEKGKRKKIKCDLDLPYKQENHPVSIENAPSAKNVKEECPDPSEDHLDPSDVIEENQEPSSEEGSPRKRGRPKSVTPHKTSADNLDETPPVKRGRGRPRGPAKEKPENSKHHVKLYKHKDLPMHKVKYDVGDEGSEPGDSVEGQLQWSMSMDTFPSVIVKDGVLLYKGRSLMSMVCKFYTLECDLCPEPKIDYDFEDLHELFSHYINAHNTKGYVSCCNTQISTYTRAIMHMAKHLQPEAFKCETCGYVVARPKFLESHRKTHLPDDEKPFACYICKKTFCWKTALFNHMITHQPPEERKKHQCHICGKTYDNIGSLSTHKKLKHTDRAREVLVCDICAKNFSTRAGLTEHKATIHQPREFHQIQCPTCGQWCMNKRCLKTHMLLHSDVQYECSLCEYTTKKKALLKRHNLTKHTDIRPFPCETCPKSFKTKHALVGHIRQAHGEQNIFPCNFCDRQFRSSTNFYTHRKTQHPVELEEMRLKEEKKKQLLRIEAGVESVEDGDEIEIEIIAMKEEEVDAMEQPDESGELLEVIQWQDDE